MPEIAYFEPNLKIWPQGSIWTPRPQLLVPGGLPDVVLMILQPMVDFEKGVGRVISGYLASSTLKHPRFSGNCYVNTRVLPRIREMYAKDTN